MNKYKRQIFHLYSNASVCFCEEAKSYSYCKHYNVKGIKQKLIVGDALYTLVSDHEIYLGGLSSKGYNPIKDFEKTFGDKIKLLKRSKLKGFECRSLTVEVAPYK